MKLASYLLYGSFAAVIVMTIVLAVTAEPYPTEFGTPPEDWNKDTVFTLPYVDSSNRDKIIWK